MEELRYSAFDVACIVDSLDLGARHAAEIKKKIWKQDKAFILPEYVHNYKKWLYDIQYWSDYLYDKVSLDAEFPAVKQDLISQGLSIDEADFMTENFDIDLFFKSMRIKLLYVKKGGYMRMKLKTLIYKYGYRRRSTNITSYLKNRLDYYQIGTYTRGKKECDIKNISIYDMITFRIKETSDVKRADEAKNKDVELDSLDLLALAYQQEEINSLDLLALAYEKKQIKMTKSNMRLMRE